MKSHVALIRGGTMGAKAPLRFQKRGKWKNMGYFHASKLLKLAFLSSLMRKYVLWKGFYHDFSTKRAAASGGFAPWPPSRGSVSGPQLGALPPGPPRFLCPPNDLPWHRPWHWSSPCMKIYGVSTLVSWPDVRTHLNSLTWVCKPNPAIPITNFPIGMYIVHMYAQWLHKSVCDVTANLIGTNCK